MVDHWWIAQQVAESRMADLHRSVNAVRTSARVSTREASDASASRRHPVGRDSVVSRIRSALGRRVIALGTLILGKEEGQSPCVGPRIAGQCL